MKKTRKQINKKLEEEFRENKLYAQDGPHQLVLILNNLKPDYNVGKIIRTCEFLGIRKLYLHNIDSFDPYIAKGAMRYLVMHNVQSPEDFFVPLLQEGYRFFALDLNANYEITQIKYPEKTAFILGHEEFGVDPDILANDLVESVKITGHGNTQSLNVSIAAAIACHEYLRQKKI